MGVASAVRTKGDFGAITSEAELHRALRLVAFCDLRIKQVEIEYNVAAAQLKKDRDSRVAEMTAQKAPLLAAIQTFVTEHRTEVLKGNQSTGFAFGRVGFRKKPGTISLPERGTEAMEALVDRIQRARAASPSIFAKVWTRTMRYVLKGDISGLSDEWLTRIGLERTRGDETFFVEVELDKIREVSDETL